MNKIDNGFLHFFQLNNKKNMLGGTIFIDKINNSKEVRETIEKAKSNAFKKYKTDLTIEDRLIGRLLAKPLAIKDENLIIPEYKIELLNKAKKLINTIYL